MDPCQLPLSAAASFTPIRLHPGIPGAELGILPKQIIYTGTFLPLPWEKVSQTLSRGFMGSSVKYGYIIPSSNAFPVHWFFVVCAALRPRSISSLLHG